MNQYHANFILPFNITIPEHSQIKEIDPSEIIVNHFIQSMIKLVLKMAKFSISTIMVN